MDPNVRTARVTTTMVDEDGFARLLEDLRPKLLMFAARRGFGSAADDIVQETLVAATIEFRAGRFHHRSSPQTWVYGILRHKMGDERRRDAREGRHLIPLRGSESEDLDRMPEGAFYASANPEFEVWVREVLDSLPPRHWLVLMLNQRQNLTTVEIAKLIRLSPGRVGAILAEAKKWFRERISGREEKTRRRRLIK